MTPSFPREHAPSLFYNIIGRYLKKQKSYNQKVAQDVDHQLRRKIH